MRSMRVEELGEFRLIDRLAEVVGTDPKRFSLTRLGERDFELLLSIGDDAAAWSDPGGRRVFTTDTMVDGVHFKLEATEWADLGWKSLAVNLSDLAAMGCEPLCSVVTLGLTGDLPVDGIVEMYRGMKEAADRFGGAVVGGDVVRSPVLFVTVAMVGFAPDGEGGEARPLLTRDAATVGDRVAVTGHLGCSAAGLRAMIDGLDLADETARHLRDAHARPIPRLAAGAALARCGVRAAMDVSDGLVDDLTKVCVSSGVGAVVHAEEMPADRFLMDAFPNDYLPLALGGGEDYELLFAAPSGTVEAVSASLDVPVAVIGEIVEGPPGVTVLDAAGNPLPVSATGWDHFAGRR